MKHLIKLSVALTIGLGLTLSACKKNQAVDNKPADKTDYKALSKQIAMNFYKSLNSGSTGFKTTGGAEKRVNTTGPQCGDVVVTPNYYQSQSGDTTRLTTGNSVFTYICNNNILDEYKLADTVTTKETYPGSESIHTTIQGYNTRALNYNYAKTYCIGAISASYIQRKFANNVTTDSLSWATKYNLAIVEVSRINNEAVLTGGHCDFTSKVYHKGSLEDIYGWTEQHKGFIAFLPDDIIKVTFMTNITRTYLINTKTGSVSEI